LHPSFLAPAWRRFRYGWPGWGYWEDVIVNIIGFVPVGFLLLNYLSVVHPVKRRVATAILCGFFLSLTIETSQTFLPTRDSDMSDLITNTLGTAVGVALYRWALARRAWSRVTTYSLGVMANPREHASDGISNRRKESKGVAM
jgi:glycopeptide antibiotics resistance protein